jgi:iron(III) transport system ATP-binding protein
MNIVEIRDVRFSYQGGRSAVLDGVSLEVKQGEIVGLLGPSGSGKSTLLRLIAGLETPSSGQILVGGAVVVNDAVYMPPEKRGIGMVFQDYALFPHLTVASNVEFGLHKLARTERKQRAADMLELVQLQDYGSRYPHELSGGQQQRIALARALAPRPSVLLMDEPFSNLDAALKSGLRLEVRDILRKAEITCLFVTHDPDDVNAICDRSVMLGRMQTHLQAHVLTCV